MKENKLEKYRRKPVKVDVDIYVEEVKMKIKRAIDTVDKILKKQGIEGLPLKLYTLYEK